MFKKITTIICLFLSSIVILLTTDIINTQMVYNELDLTAINVGYLISKSGGITDSIVAYVKKEAGADIVCSGEGCTSPKQGDTYFYTISKNIVSVVLKNKVECIKIKRSVIIGLYN